MLFGQSAGAGSVSAHVAMPHSSDLFSAALMQSGGFAGWSAQHMKLKLEGTGRRQLFYGFPICFLCFCMFLWIPTNVIKLGLENPRTQWRILAVKIIYEGAAFDYRRVQ